MSYLNLAAGEPWIETLGVMLFPDDERKRQGFIARHWSGFYPRYIETGGEPLDRAVELAIMKGLRPTRLSTAKWPYAGGTGD